MQSNTNRGLKILFLGLDNAGKTSILLTLKRQFSRIQDLTPTKGIDTRMFEFMGMQVGEWDLGGQRVYRKQYMHQRQERIFGGAGVIIFVIDIQDKKRLVEGLEYLQELFYQVNLLGTKPMIYIFFHKYDPVSIVGANSELNNYSLDLRNKIKETFNYDKIDFFKTSIYDLQTIIIAMSKILLSNHPQAEAIETTIQEFAKKVDAEGMELIDDNSLVVGSYYANSNVEELMNSLTPLFLEVNEIFERAEVRQFYTDEPEDEMVIRRFARFFIFKKFKLERENTYFYILGCKKDSKFNKEDIATFTNLIKQIIQLTK